MERAKLDRSRPFIQTIGVAEERYKQDGKKFDHTGLELRPAGHVEVAPPASPPPAVATAPKPPAPEPAPPNWAYPTATEMAQVASPPLETWTHQKLQKTYKQLTGKGFPSGTKKPEMVRIMRGFQIDG
jgi:hypothetical protein